MFTAGCLRDGRKLVERAKNLQNLQSMDNVFTAGNCGKCMDINSSMFVIIWFILRQVWTLYFSIIFVVWIEISQMCKNNVQTLQSMENVFAAGNYGKCMDINLLMFVIIWSILRQVWTLYFSIFFLYG